jgi:hypothetical protein
MATLVRSNRATIGTAVLTTILLTTFAAGCNGEFPLPPIPATWTRHTISAAHHGADGVKLGDINGNGLMDLAVAWEESGVVTVHLNPGPTTARQPWPSVVVGRGADVEDAVFVDVDNNGRLDLVSCCEGNTRRMYVHWAPLDDADLLNPAAWTTEVIPATVGVQQWMFCMPAQLHDSGVQLIAGGKGSGASIGYLSAQGDPRNLANWTWTPLADAAWIMSIIPADVDGDGDLDIVYTDRKGAGRGAYWLENPLIGDGLPLWRKHRIGATDDEAMFMDLGDIDGDGRLDALVATSGRAVIHYRPVGNPRLPWSATPITWPNTFGTGKAVRIADLTGDGSLELVFNCENAGGGRFGLGRLTQLTTEPISMWTATPLADTAGRKFDVLQLLDVSGNGYLDVITTEESANLGVVWYENPG